MLWRGQRYASDRRDAKARKKTIGEFYYAHSCRQLDVINQRLDRIGR